ncbi:MAG: 1-acyl-sn-glycerol-3-phosphate acyltransferase [Lachnospiraceae bacterium]
MKIPVEKRTYQEVMTYMPWSYRKPCRQSKIARWLLKTLSEPELRKVNFEYTQEGMEQLGAKEPALFLMNHSSFLDLEIASHLLQKRPFHIVCTNDGFVGKEGLMRWIGCIPTKKFITDVRLVKDMNFVINNYQSSILMYPEASYSFDGTQTPLPHSLGKCIKLLKIPVVMIKTKGAFLRDPLYNALQIRKVDVSAKVEYLLSKEKIEVLSAKEINEMLAKQFTYDHFKTQAEEQICVDEPFRADGLHRVLYKCSHCGSEEHMHGEGVTITCENCGSRHELTEYGMLRKIEKEEAERKETGRFRFVTDWYRWQRECVRQELLNQNYKLDVDVEIMMLIDAKKIYDVGEGHLTHDHNGFTLTGCDGQLQFSLKPSASYSLYADYFWYEIGDMISIGDTDVQYYCFPKTKCNVAKARLATEELYKMTITSRCEKQKA